MVESPLETPDFLGFQPWRKPVNDDFSGFGGCHAPSAPAWGRFGEAKVGVLLKLFGAPHGLQYLGSGPRPNRNQS